MRATASSASIQLASFGHVGLKCNVVRDPKRPLKATEDAGNFKLYESDTGMLASRYDISVARGLYSDDRTLNLDSCSRTCSPRRLLLAGVICSTT